MGEQDDERNIALGVVAGVVLFVIAGVIALAATRGLPRAATASPNLASAQSAQKLAADPRTVVHVLYFEVGTDQLPTDAREVLTRVVEVARSRDGISVLISGFHDASGDAAKNQELAKRRAEAVHHALIADGVAPAALVMAKPAETTGGSDPRAARRVELRLQ